MIHHSQEDRKNNATYGIELMEVFPKVVQQQELGWNMNDAYQTISVELMFHSWEIADTDPSSPMGQKQSPGFVEKESESDQEN